MHIPAALSSLVPGDAVRTVINTAQSAVGAIKDLADTHRQNHPPLPTVASVDPARYAGRWYELARLPILFQKDATVSIAEYTLFADGTIGVHNIAYLGEKRDSSINGQATAAAGAEQTFARLRVRFGGVVSLVPVPAQGNYWILALAADYSMALVGTPDRRSLWLLGRDRHAGSTPLAREYLALAASLGFDTSRVLHDDWELRTTVPRPTMVTSRED